MITLVKTYVNKENGMRNSNVERIDMKMQDNNYPPTPKPPFSPSSTKSI